MPQSVIFGENPNRRQQEFAADMYARVEKARDSFIAWYLLLWTRLWATGPTQTAFPDQSPRTLQAPNLTQEERITALGPGLQELMSMAGRIKEAIDPHLATLGATESALLQRKFRGLVTGEDGKLQLPVGPAGKKIQYAADGSGQIVADVQMQAASVPQAEATEALPQPEATHAEEAAAAQRVAQQAAQ